jgi:hypothetical protein
LFLTPNLLLSKKSTNARMGAGVGSFVRLAILLKSYYSFVEFNRYSTIWVKKFSRVISRKYPLKFISQVK